MDHHSSSSLLHCLSSVASHHRVLGRALLAVRVVVCALWENGGLTKTKNCSTACAVYPEGRFEGGAQNTAAKCPIDVSGKLACVDHNVARCQCSDVSRDCKTPSKAARCIRLFAQEKEENEDKHTATQGKTSDNRPCWNTAFHFSGGIVMMRAGKTSGTVESSARQCPESPKALESWGKHRLRNPLCRPKVARVTPGDEGSCP